MADVPGRVDGGDPDGSASEGGEGDASDYADELERQASVVDTESSNDEGYQSATYTADIFQFENREFCEKDSNRHGQSHEHQGLVVRDAEPEGEGAENAKQSIPDPENQIPEADE